MRVYDLECVNSNTQCSLTNYQRWSMPSQDLSSSRTGAGVFDFDGDDLAEAVYADECFLRVYDGNTGEVWFSTFRTSCTWYENPTIANTDDDQSVELIVGSNANCAIGCPAVDPIHKGIRCANNSECTSNVCTNGFCRCTANTDCPTGYVCSASGFSAEVTAPSGGTTCRAYHPPGVGLQGVRVISDAAGEWKPSRSIWNQHAYTLHGVRDDGTIPRSSERLGLKKGYARETNNFRQNRQLYLVCETGKTQPCSVSHGSGISNCTTFDSWGPCEVDTCDAGWTPGLFQCDDVNECTSTVNPCAAAPCFNLPGTFSCGCPLGFQNPPNCTDINECASYTARCSGSAACTNTNGSYTCACNTGYSGNGFTCSPILVPPPTPTPPLPECSPGDQRVCAITNGIGK
jgi:hypothetical protein